MSKAATNRPLRRTVLRLEALEVRNLLAGFQPTAVEQLFLEQLNDARANPAAYGASIGLDLHAVAPSQPLAFNPLLVQASRLHSMDMSARGYFAHVTPEGVDPGGRLTAVGFGWTGYGESIAGGGSFRGTADALSALIIDAGVSNLGHRRQLLAIDSIFQNQNQVGVGILQGTAGPLTNYYTIDSAAGFDPRPFITGVVYRDNNGNNHYDVSEGLGGVTITVVGVGSITNFDSGGYSFQVNPGTYTVVASGGSLPAPVMQTVVVGTTNSRLNFLAPTYDPKNDALVRKLYLSTLGRAAGDAEVAMWRPTVNGPNGWFETADAIERSPEARTRLVKSWYMTYLGRQAKNGEEQGWVRALVAGATEEQVLRGLLGSQEYYLRARAAKLGANADQGFVRALFQQFLGRTAGQREVDHFVQDMLPVMGRGGLASVVLGSQEYRSRAVTAMYTELLHRSSAPSAGEVDSWVTSGLDLARIRIGFKSSLEYFLNG
jgi:uncharacterized protein YkwD